MKFVSEKRALERLKQLKSDYQQTIKRDYQHRAKNCETCETPGACCLDAHFVNVHITRLEADAIREFLDSMPESRKAKVYDRIGRAIKEYKLTAEGDTFKQTFACPLFEKGTGCLVHHAGKPLPCITHACYEREEDLPPDSLQTEQEGVIEHLNRRTYGEAARWLPLPLAICQNRLR